MCQRRCIHDEYGNVDPVKANEVPIPRGSATKKRRVSDEDSTATAKRMKHESSYEDDYIGRDIHARHSLPNHFSVGSAHLQDIAFSAQQALARGQDDLVPVDPALQAYANSAFSAMEMAPSYATNGDGIMSSIEQQVEGDISMDGMDFSQHNSQAHQSLTPGPPPHNDTIHVQRIGYPTSDTIHVQSNGYPAPSTMHAQPNGFPASDTVHVQPNGFSSNAVRRPSSPVSPRHMSAVSPGTNTFDQYMASPTLNHNGHSHSLNHNNHYDFTADSDFPPPPATPTTNTRPPNSSSGIASHTPSRARASKTPKSTSGARRRDSKDGIKLEAGLGMGMNMGLMGMEMMIDPSLDQASIDLIKQLQQEELGLRRRQS
jgi:F-box/leucine-rich repeat protein 10/11